MRIIFFPSLFAIHEWGWTREQVENIVGEKA